MRKVSNFIFVLLLSLSIFHLPIYPQSLEHGAIQGTVAADTGEFLPGAEVMLSSPNLMGGDRFAITNESGKFRFIALWPGTYSVTVTLQGFAPASIEDIRLHIGQTLSVAFALEVGAISEAITVVGQAPMVDVKDSQTGTTTLPIDFLQHIPNLQHSSDIANLAPGVIDRQAYGGNSSLSISWNVDGANTDDPGNGSGILNVDYNIVEEATISGIGAPAEYGGFQGAVFSLITKSGGNELRGDVNFVYQSSDWNSDNTGTTGFDKPPTTSLFDVSVHLGGPIIRDKLWFFTSLSYYSRTNQQPDFEFDATLKEPKALVKLTFQPTKNDRFQAFLQHRRYWRDYSGGGLRREVATTTDRIHFRWFGNISWLHLFSDTTFAEAKLNHWVFESVSHFKGGADTPGHRDDYNGWRTVNGTGTLNQWCGIHTGNASVSHHADDFAGSHDFKFGVEARQGFARDRDPVPGGIRYNDWDFQPYYRTVFEGLEGNYSIRSNPKKVTASVFAQDSWTVTDKLTLNLGIRWNHNQMYMDSRPDEKYKASGFAPRIGFAYDLLGDHSTALKAHWGRYYEFLGFVNFYPLGVMNANRIYQKWGDGEEIDGYWYAYNIPANWADGPWVTQFTEYGNLPDGTTPTTMDTDIKHPHVDQFSIGLSRELGRDLSVEITYINKVFKDILDLVNTTAEYEKISETDPETGAVYPIYSQTNDPEDNRFLISNPYAGQTESVMTDPYRKYNGLQLQLSKRFSNNWQLMASYVYSTTRGNYTNTTSDEGLLANFSRDPNSQYNTDGKLGIDPTHMLKIQSMASLPWGINVSGAFSLISGRTWQRRLRVGGLGQGSVNIYTEPRGSRRYPTRTNLDMRLEKVFYFGGDRSRRFGLTFDVFNVFNAGTTTRIDSSVGSSFGEISRIVDSRGFRVGFRFYY